MPAAERRAAILSAAIHVFVERSYGGATTAEIAREADCNEALIFRHFGSKLDLFVATLERATVLICEEAEESAGTETGLSQLRALAHAKARGGGRYRDLGRLRFVAAAEARDPVIARALSRHMNGLHAWTAGRLRAARELGELSPGVDPELAAWEWSGVMTLTSLRAMAGDAAAPGDFERMANALVDSWAAPRTNAR
jgi:AcrR family transcriptional regulator